MYHSSPITDALIRKVVATPDEAALFIDNQQITYRQLYNGTIAIAEMLQQNGFTAHDRAVIAAQPGPEFVQIIYALIFLKGQIAIIDPEMGRDNYNSKLQQFNPGWAFVDSRLLLLQEHPILRWLHLRKSPTAPYFPRTKGVKKVACGYWMPLVQKALRLPKTAQNLPEPSSLLTNNKPDQNLENEFLITYTSGTLSEPKGVVHTTGSVASSVTLIANLLDPEQENLMAGYLPQYVLIAMAAGLKALIYDPKKMDTLQKLRFLGEKQITTVMGPPADFLPLVEHCEKTGEKLPESLRHILLGSAPVTRGFLLRLISVCHDTTRITCLYGMTENLVVAYTDGRFKCHFECAGDLLGTPAPGVQVKVENDELFIKSPQLFGRYFHLNGRDEWHATGDLGTVDESGRIILLGRKKDMIIRRNQNIYPALYESTINRIPGVTEAVLVGVYDEKIADEKVILFVEGAENLQESDLMKKLRNGQYAIDAEALPDEIIFRKLPRSGRQHKVDKQQLRLQVDE